MNQPAEHPNPLAAQDLAHTAMEDTPAGASDGLGRQVWARYGAWPGIVAHQRTHGLVQRLLYWSTTAGGWPARQQVGDPGYSTPHLVFRHGGVHAGDGALPADLPLHSASSGSHAPGSAGRPVQPSSAATAVQARRLPAAPLATRIDRPLGATPVARSPLPATPDQQGSAPPDSAALPSAQNQAARAATAASGRIQNRAGAGPTLTSSPPPRVQRSRSSTLHRPISRLGGGLLNRMPASTAGALAAAHGSAERVASPSLSSMIFKSSAPRAVTTPGVQTASSTQESLAAISTAPVAISPVVVVQRRAAAPVEPNAPQPQGQATSVIQRAASTPHRSTPSANPPASPVVAQSAGYVQTTSTATRIGSTVRQRYLNPAAHRPTATEVIRPTTHLSTPASTMVHTARIASGDPQTEPAMPLVVSASRVAGQAVQPTPASQSSTPSSPAASQPIAPVNPSGQVSGARSVSQGMVLRSTISRSESTSSQGGEQSGQDTPAASPAGALARTTPAPHPDAAAPPLGMVVQRRAVERGNEATSAPGITPAHTFASTRPTTRERAATAGALGAAIYRRYLAGGGARPGPSTPLSRPTLQASSHRAAGDPLPVAALPLPGRDPVASAGEQPAITAATAPQSAPTPAPMAQPVIVHPVERATSQVQSGQLGFNLQARYVDRPAARHFHPMVQAAAAQTATAAPVVVTASYVTPGASAPLALAADQSFQPPLVTSGSAALSSATGPNAQPPLATGMVGTAQGTAAVQRAAQRSLPAAGGEQPLSPPVVQRVMQRSANPADVILSGGPFVQPQRSAGTTSAPVSGSAPLMDLLPMAQVDRDDFAQRAGSTPPSSTLAPSLALPIRQSPQLSTPPAATASSVVLQRADSYDSQPSTSDSSASSGRAAEVAGASFSVSDMDDAQLERMADKVYRIIEQRLIVERESMGL